MPITTAKIKVPVPEILSENNRLPDKVPSILLTLILRTG